MGDDTLLLEKSDGIALVTFNNPKVMNALTTATFCALEGLLAELETDAAVRVLILTGAGDKAFIAGGDIRDLARLDVEGARAFALLAQRVLDRIETFAKPVIAAVNGYALGGGCELAMACDLRIAAQTARFGQPEVKLGIIPGFAGTQRLARLVGKAKAKELIFTGEMVDAAEAVRIGLVNRTVPAESLLAEARRLALQMADKSASAIALAKEAIDNGVEMDFARASRYEADLFALCFATADCREGLAAFLEKRPARFRGDKQTSS
ncbi:MAG: enoyl-CoA hydratase-related protein [Desulfuromonadales bacterium]|nr:enoyl-CoA hydratase-related protein [Desulfuromonadales bacterium]